MTRKSGSGNSSSHWLTRHAHPNWAAARSPRGIHLLIRPIRLPVRPGGRAGPAATAPVDLWRPVPRATAELVFGHPPVVDLGRALRHWHAGRCGGIAAYSAHRFSRGGLVILSPTPSTSRTQTPNAGPSTPPAPPPGGSLSVFGINENRTITCKDSIVSVSGVSNTVVITGHCASLTVSGLKNSVTVDAADTIEASGFNNQVTYHSGSPKISKAGDGNVVQQG